MGEQRAMDVGDHGRPHRVDEIEHTIREFDAYGSAHISGFLIRVIVAEVPRFVARLTQLPARP